MDHAVVLGVGLIILAAIADTLTTLGALDRGAKEGNGWLEFFMVKLGRGWIVVKLLGTGVAIYLLLRGIEKFPEDRALLLGTMWLIAITTGFVAWRNTEVGRS